jgi:hypothetical protein
MSEVVGRQLAGGCILYRFPFRASLGVMPMGKYRGVTIADVVDHDPDYIGWLVAQDWFFEKYPRAGECLVACISIDPDVDYCTAERTMSRGGQPAPCTRPVAKLDQRQDGGCGHEECPIRSGIRETSPRFRTSEIDHEGAYELPNLAVVRIADLANPALSSSERSASRRRSPPPGRWCE